MLLEVRFLVPIVLIYYGFSCLSIRKIQFFVLFDGDTMKIIDRIENIMEEKKIKQSDLVKKLEVGKTTINSWFSKKSDPKAEYIMKIAELLEVSVEYLLTGEEPKQEHYTKEEQKLTWIYRTTNQTGKQRIMEYASEMQKLHPEQEEEPLNLSASKIS